MAVEIQEANRPKMALCKTEGLLQFQVNCSVCAMHQQHLIDPAFSGLNIWYI